MKYIRTEDAVGHTLAHDHTQIIKDSYKGARFKKGHIVTEEDIPVLLSMGKEHVYVWELEPGMVHEDDAAARLAALIGHEAEGLSWGKPSEGKISLKATRDGVLCIASERLIATNACDQLMIATLQGNQAITAGQVVAATRAIPLTIAEKYLAAAERAADVKTHGTLLHIAPFIARTAVLIATGSEVKKGLIKDRFTPVVEKKLAAFGIEITQVVYPGDDKTEITEAIKQAHVQGVDFIVCTGGMSVDPDDNTPGAIRESGCRIVTYGAPVLPGAMLCLGYFDDKKQADVATTSSTTTISAEGHPNRGCAKTCVLGLPGCVMYEGITVFDVVLPRLSAGIELTKQDIVVLGEGGLNIGKSQSRAARLHAGADA